MKLKEIRFIRGMSQKELSVMSGVHQTTISHLERGLQPPTERQKNKIAKALQLRLSAITWEAGA